MSTLRWDDGEVSARWHGPDPKQARALVALTHGAGGNMETPQLKAVCEELGTSGIAAVHFNLPYAEAGRRSPGPAARDEQCWHGIARDLAKAHALLFVGGRSYGGRMASHAVAQGAPAAGLIFLAYPLHPPGKYDRLRTAHLPAIHIPMLFLQGTKDTFARADLLNQAVASLPRATLEWIEGADHGHKVSGRSLVEVARDCAARIVRWIDRFTGESP